MRSRPKSAKSSVPAAPNPAAANKVVVGEASRSKTGSSPAPTPRVRVSRSAAEASHRNAPPKAARDTTTSRSR